MSIHLIAIGNNYEGTDYSLPDCVLDTENAERACESFATVLRLNGRNATRERVRADLVNFLGKLKRDDLALVYNSGHGTFDTIKGKRYEAVVLDGGELYYEFEMRADLLMRPKGTLLAAASDSCYSGGLPRAIGNPHRFARAIPISMCKRHTVRVPERSVRLPNAGYTACSAKEVSYSTGQGGAWSNEMWKAMAARTSRTTLPSLHKRIRKELPSNEWPQTPQFFCDPVLAKRTLKSFMGAK